MSPTQQILFALILFAGTAVQATVGFGMGLFAIPLLILVGASLPTAVAAILPCICLQATLNCWQHRAELPWRESIAMWGLRLVGLLPGLWLMYQLDGMNVNRARQAVGLVLLMALITQYYLRIVPRASIGRLWTAGTGCLSGFMAGAVGMGGPPLVLWVMAHDRTPTWQRSFLWFSFLLIMPIQIPLLVYTFGQPLQSSLMTGALFAPVGLVGAYVGDRVGRVLSRRRLRLAMSLVLLAIAIHSIIGPFFRNG